MGIAVLALAALAIGIGPQSPWPTSDAAYMTCPGIGPIERWGIDEESNHMRILYRNGEVRKVYLKQFVVENGGWWLSDLVAVGPHRVAGFNTYGIYLLDDRGHTIGEFDHFAKVRIDRLEGKRLIRVRPDDGFDNRPRFAGWNGKTLLGCVEFGTSKLRRAELISRSLRPLRAIDFGNASFTAHAEGPKGWLLTANGKGRNVRIRLSNSGKVQVLKDRTPAKRAARG